MISGYVGLTCYWLSLCVRQNFTVMRELIKSIVNLLQGIYEILKKIMLSDVVPAQLPPWLGKQEVMDYLRITESTYYRWIDMGLLEPRGPEGQDRYFKDDLIALFEKRKLRKRLPRQAKSKKKRRPDMGN